MSTPSPGDQEYLSFKETLTAVCEAAVKLVGVEHSGLVLFSPDKEYGEVYGEVITEYPVLQNSVVGQRFALKGIEPEQQLVKSRQPMVVQDVAAENSLGVVQTVLMSMGVKSIVVVPIVVDDEVKGSFSFDSLNEIREFKEPEVKKCASLAKFASLVVKNFHLLKNLEALRKAMLTISSEPKRVPLLQKITKEAVRLLKAAGGGIDELDDRKKELTIVAKFEMPDRIVGKTMKVGEGLAGRIIERKLDHLCEPDYQNWDNKAPYFKNEPSLESLVGVPLCWNEKTTGVLWLNDKKPRVFSTEDIELLKGLAEPASIALEHSSLREKEISEAERLRKLAKATNEIFVNLATGSRQDRLNLIADKAHTIIDAELCSILLVEKPGWLKLEAGHGYAEGKFEKGKALEILPGPGTGLTGYIACIGKIFNESGDRLNRHFARAVHLDGYTDHSPSGQCFSLLGIPLMSDTGDVKGLILINNKKDRDGKANYWTCFSKEDEAIGEILGQAALVAIETADLQDRYKTLLDTSNAVALTKLPEHGLAALAQVVLRQINKSFCRILFYHDSDESIQVIAAEKASGTKGEFQWDQRLGETTKVDGWIGLEDSLKTGEFVVQQRGEPDYDTNLDKLSDLIKLRDNQDVPLKIHSLLRGPLKVKEQIVGLLIIGELDPDVGFSSFEVDLAKSIATQASQFIERLQSNKKLLLDLFETERKISKSADARVALKWVAETVFEVGRAYGRKVTVVDVNVRNGNEVRVVAAYPEDQLKFIRGIVGHPFVLSTGIGDEHRMGLVGRVLRTGKPIKESDVRSNADYIAIHNETLSQLVVPIKEGEAVVGALSVESAEASAFDDQDLMLVEGIAVLAASALSREKYSREYKKVRTVALAGAAARLWRHGLKERAKLIIDRINVASQHPHSDLLGLLTKVSEDAHEIENFRFIPLSSEHGVKDEILNELLVDYLNDFRDDLELQGLEFGMPLNLGKTSQRRVKINRDWFRKALDIFLNNAYEAILSANPKFIAIETEILEDDRSCRIRIRNSGPRIPVDVWEKMGQEQILKDGRDGEKGGGLLLADLILAVYGGKIEKIENQENNIVLGLTLPMLPNDTNTELTATEVQNDIDPRSR
jgi:GAF domain-containing protein